MAASAVVLAEPRKHGGSLLH